jgi:CRISPR-associated protein Csm2
MDNGKKNSNYGRNDFETEDYFNKSGFNAEWIKSGATKETVEFASKVGKYMAKKHLSNSKIRSIYGEIKRIQMESFEKDKTSFYLLKPKVAYAYGRDNNNQGLYLFKLVFDNSYQVVTDQNTFDNFCNLFEAILAYHKANGGKD